MQKKKRRPDSLVRRDVLDEKLEEACRVYSKMGFKGFKVDFMDRDDQLVVDMIYRIAVLLHGIKLIDLHGMYKPTGLNQTYPNVINFEGIFGLEQSKWSREDLVPYEVTFPTSVCLQVLLITHREQ